MYCSCCGNKIENGNKFCVVCGNNITIKSKEERDLEDKRIASLILGIFGLIPFNIIYSIIALVLGASYKQSTNKTPAGLVLGIIGLSLFGLILLLLFMVILIPIFLVV